MGRGERIKFVSLQNYGSAVTPNFVQELAGLELHNEQLQSELEQSKKKCKQTEAELTEERAVSAKRDESIKALQKVHRSRGNRHYCSALV